MHGFKSDRDSKDNGRFPVFVARIDVAMLKLGTWCAPDQEMSADRLAETAPGQSTQLGLIYH